jgi:hypothetical protein
MPVRFVCQGELGNLAGEAVLEEVEPRRMPFQIHSVRSQCKRAAHLGLSLHSISMWCTSSQGRTGSGVRPLHTYFFPIILHATSLHEQQIELEDHIVAAR